MASDEKSERGIAECECCVTKLSKLVECPYCHYHACVKCIARFVTTQITEASCMSCKRPYTLAFIENNFTIEFRKKIYPAHRKKILFELEKAQLPATIPFVQQVKLIPELESQIQTISVQINELTYQRSLLEYQLSAAKNVRNGVAVDKPSEASSPTYQKPCPVNDCRGFLSSAGKCGLCGAKCCVKCREIKNNDEKEEKEHVCNEDTLQTIALLEKECRTCPKCHVPIYRISGCDQMWCVQCRTAFNWRTGKIETGPVHNPHYFQYRQAHIENIGMPDCAQNPRDYAVQLLRHIQQQQGQGLSLLPRLKLVEPTLSKCKQYIFKIRGDHIYNHTDLSYFLQILVSTPDHLRYVHLTRIAADGSNLDLRIKYLMSEIDSDTFQASILRRQKLHEKHAEYRQIIETFLQVSTESMIKMMRSILDHWHHSHEVNQHVAVCIDEIENVLDFANEAIDMMNAVHGGRKLMKLGEIL